MGINRSNRQIRLDAKRTSRRWRPLALLLGCVLLIFGATTTSFAAADAGSTPGNRTSTTAHSPAPEELVALEMIDMPLDLRETAEWAVDLFAEADLDLPPLRFVHHGGATEPCLGRAGTHREVEGVSVIDICAATADRPTRVMVLHETAHAWLAHALTSERKAAFQELRGWTHWRDYEAAPWHENGTEQAAEIMVWGLIDEPLRMARIYETSCVQLETGYRTLTGADPLHGLRDHC